MSNSSRIVKNTLALYFRQILIMLVSLYTVRVVLNVLGAEDYGIYNVVAGVVTMFGFLSGAMASASQRYFSFELGKNNQEGLEKIFAITVTIYAILALAIILLAETLGLWFVCKKLVIPAERLTAAKWIYQCAIISFLFTIMTTPYMSSIIAHENMNVYAYVSIVEAVLKLAIVFVLKIGTFDKLILYGLLQVLVAAINTSLYRFYCKRHYRECKFRFLWEREKIKEMFSYVGWNLFGSAVGVFKNQILNILLNQFFGAVVNAARAIAFQISAAVSSFSQNFSTAIRPQIIKSYAADEKEDCIRLAFRGCRLTFFLMLIFTIPLVLEMPFVLKVWLKNPPENTVLFARLVLLDVLIDSVSYPIMTLAQATGKIKLYQSVVGGILLLNFPVSWIVLSFGVDAWSVFVVGICITTIAFVVRLFIVRHLISFSLRSFCKDVVLRIFAVSLISVPLPLVLEFFIQNEILRFFLVCIASVLMTGGTALFIGMTKNERSALLKKLRGKIHA